LAHRFGGFGFGGLFLRGVDPPPVYAPEPLKTSSSHFDILRIFLVLGEGRKAGAFRGLRSPV
jgi:hypothetical protein